MSKRRLAIAGILLSGAVFVVAFIVFPVLRSGFDFEIDYNEGWNAYHQMDVGRLALYPSTLGYVGTNYTPLSFYLIGALARFGDPIMIGRLISIASFLVLIIAIGVTARNLGTSRIEALLASVMGLGVLGAFHSGYIGIDDPQLLASTVSVLGLMVWSKRPASPARTISALGLLLIAGLVKQTLLALPLAIAIELLLRDRRQAVRFVVIGGAMAAVAVLALYAAYGAGLFVQILAPRHYSLHEGAAKTLSFLAVSSAGLPLLLLFLAIHARAGANRFALVYLITALCVGALLSGASGAASNMFIDVEIALCLAIALAVRCLREEFAQGPRTIAAFVALSMYGIALQAPMALERLRDGVAGSLRAKEAEFQSDLAFMKNHPGAAYCHSPMLCFRAQRAFSIDPFSASQAIRLRRLDPAPMLGDLSHGRFAVVQLSTEEGAHALGPPLRGGPDIEHEFRRILKERYHVARTGTRRVFHLPN
jgi:hypothetical protein